MPTDPAPETSAPSSRRPVSGRPSHPADGVDRRYLDPARAVSERVEIVLRQMTVPEKAGLLFHAMITPRPGGELAEASPAFGLPSTADYVQDRLLSHFNLLGPVGAPTELAHWHNRLQELAAQTRLGIPFTLSTDPRHAFSENPGAAFDAAAFSQWPEPLGLAAIGDADLVEQFADIARQEYLAVGIRVALHPQIDLGTEPRWSRQFATFGEDVELTCRLAAAYIRGFQGPRLGPESVATMTKHFPGGGPQLDGEDPHFGYGREQVHPGDQFELHLRPFRAAIDAGTSQLMPYYGMPIGTPYEEVGFGFNPGVITGLLRDELGFDGIVCTDWGLINDSEIMGDHHPARAWGVESLSPRERMIKALEAGVDQFGGESDSNLLIDIVAAGEISGERLDTSVRRLLREKFVLGLFDRPFLAADHAAEVVGAAAFTAAGEAAQRAAVTLLRNEERDGRPTLPLAWNVRIYVEGIDRDLAAEYGSVIDDPSQSDVAIVRLSAPFEPRTATRFESFFHAGSLDFDPAIPDRLRKLADVTTLVVDVYLDRPAILTPIAPLTAALLADFGASAQAVLDVIFGRAEPRGRLPFDLPTSMAAVRASRSDVPFDTTDPLYRCHHGLNYS